MTEIWHVQILGDEVKTLTLDALDDAFQNGWIDASTLVLAPRATTWARLGDVAGLEQPGDAPVNSVAPIAVDLATHAQAPGAARGESSDLELDFDTPPELRPKRRGRIFAGVAGLLVLGGLGFAAFSKLGGPSTVANMPSPATTQQVTAAAPPAEVTTAPPPPAPAPNAVEPGRVALTDQQKIALAEQDKAREAARANRKAKTPPSHRSGKSSSSPFIKGGNKYDPLNSSL